METLVEAGSGASRTTPTEPIVVATDGAVQSDGALAVARALADKVGTNVDVVAVQPAMNLIVPDASLLLSPSAIARLTAELSARVNAQCARVSVAGSGPELVNPIIEQGQPERVINRVADETEARLVVVGLGRHDIADRIFGSETALKVAQLSSVPVLAVPDNARTAPKSAVVAVDFSEPSFAAAQSAAQLVGDGGTLHLVHVAPRERELLDPWISDAEYQRLVRQRFYRLRARLNVPAGVEITESIRTGDIARQLIELAKEWKADVIAAGSHGHGFVARLVLGSVTTSLLRGANCMVLVVPRAASRGAERSRTMHVGAERWSTVLEEVSRSNAGRRVRLELDDPDIGAQAQENDYPLQGIAYDPHDQRVEIMLGLPKAGAPHLSRSIGNVTSVDVLTNEKGEDVAVRLRHGAGQTLISFTRAA